MLTTTKTYDPLDRLASGSTAPSSAPQAPSSAHTYTYDARNQPVKRDTGGLLAVTKHEAPGTKHTYYATYDANGNVSEYLDANGASVAHYEYSPFGRTTAATGAKAADFAHRFSTKYLDEHGLYYYGLRSYNPELGRWINRDPIEEVGGENLAGAMLNSPVQYYDALGEAPAIVPLVPVLILAGGSLAIEVGVRLVCVVWFDKGMEGYIRTPVSILLHFSGVFNAAAQTACNGPYTVRTKLWKDERGCCHSEYHMFCLDGGSEVAGTGY